ETALAVEYSYLPPINKGSIPLFSDQMNASSPLLDSPSPTMTEPSAETSKAELEKLPPGRSPKPAICPSRQQKASLIPWGEEDLPTMTEPSADAAHASLHPSPELRTPKL